MGRGGSLKDLSFRNIGLMMCGNDPRPAEPQLLGPSFILIFLAVETQSYLGEGGAGTPILW